MKSIKSKVVSGLVNLQDNIGLSKGFPISCFTVGGFDSLGLFHDSDTVEQLASADWEQLGVLSGAFASRNEARSRGFSGEISKGWHEVVTGKGMNQRFIFVWCC